MKSTEWQSLHMTAYKNYMKQRYDEDVDIPYHNIHLLNKIKDEDKFDEVLIHINDVN